MPDRSPPDYVTTNRKAWDIWNPEYERNDRKHWTTDDVSWGIWSIPESELQVLPDLEGKDTLELGCGTGYVSSWLARRGARAVGLDNSPRQLASAHRFQEEFGIEFPLVLAIAEQLPFRDESFDLAVSEYGASIWSDPYLWVPEAARVLRRGGELVFLGNGTLLTLTAPEEDDVPPGDRLLRDYFGMHRFEWPEPHSVEFHLGHGDWIRLLRANGFEVTDLIELRPPEGARSRYPVTLEWARRWPSEEVWKARLRGG